MPNCKLMSHESDAASWSSLQHHWKERMMTSQSQRREGKYSSMMKVVLYSLMSLISHLVVVFSSLIQVLQTIFWCINMFCCKAGSWVIGFGGWLLVPLGERNHETKGGLCLSIKNSKIIFRWSFFHLSRGDDSFMILLLFILDVFFFFCSFMYRYF